VPNTPRYKVGLGIGYAAPRFDASLRARWVDAFTWTSGVFSGPIPSYIVADLASNWRVTSLVTAGINVRNLFDDQHWEAFGGDLMGRRALAYLNFGW
jgi:outer membrane receptor protein involved in Fe transport